MTAIANFPSKKAFKAAIETQGDVVIHDPSIMDEYTGSLKDRIESVGPVYLTNHPKRSWFAKAILRNGLIKVT